jgi:CRISPR-associated exonuclease Cas4
MFDEDNFVPVSALAHFLFCPRRAFLVHAEQLWAENQATAEGRVLHNKADLPLSTESRGTVRIARQLHLRSARLGLIGVADVVEFHLIEGGEQSRIGVPLAGLEGAWLPYPVEYKRGRLRSEEGYEVQLCAQAICLEETLGVSITAGALYFGKNRRRKEVRLGDSLRVKTEASTMALYGLLSSDIRPSAEFGAKCKQCSIEDLCMPQIPVLKHPVESYIRRMTRT